MNWKLLQPSGEKVYGQMRVFGHSGTEEHCMNC